MFRRFFIEYIESMIDDLDDIKYSHHMYFLETSLINGLVRLLGFMKSRLEK